MAKEKSCNRPAVDAENMRRSYIPKRQNVNLKDMVSAMYSDTPALPIEIRNRIHYSPSPSTTHSRTLHR